MTSTDDVPTANSTDVVASLTDASPPVLEVNDITVRFGGIVAVDAVSFDIRRHGIVGVVGPNGSGKSTLLNALTGVVPASGSVRVDGQRKALGSPGDLRRAGLIRVFQSPQLCADLPCIDNVALGDVDHRFTGFTGAWLSRRRMWRRERTRVARARSALVAGGLSTGGILRPAGALTYGEQRKLELARASVGEPVVLMLDEPSAGLNDAETRAMAERLREIRAAGATLIVVDHKIDFIDSLCERVLVLESGRLVADDTPARIWSDPAVIDAYLGAARHA